MGKLLAWIVMGAFLYGLFVLMPLKKSYEKQHVAIHGIYLIKPIPVSNFELQNVRGHQFTRANLLDHWTLLYLGFTHCEMICPTTMNTLNKSFELLQKKIPIHELPQVVFVTVDPDRDTSEKIQKFISGFNPAFIGLRGSTNSITSFARQMHINIVKKTSDDEYTFDHGTDIVLINPKAQIVALFTWPHKSDWISEDYQHIIRKYLASSGDTL